MKPSSAKRATKSAPKKKVSRQRNAGKAKVTASGQRSSDRATAKARNMRLRQQNMRDMLDGVVLIRAIEIQAGNLESLSNEIRDAKNTADEPYAVRDAIKKAETRVKVIGKLLDTHFRRLNKVLPDLRSIEVTDSEGNNLFSAFTEAVNKNQGDK